jgi:hypothetical protein
MTDGLNTLQGVRTMDSNAGTWTTPDAYAGDVDDPGSQKSYMWNSNNAVSYSDPSGFSADPYSDYLAPPPDTGPPDPYGDSGAVRASSAGDSGETAEKLSYAPMSPSQLAQQGDQSAVPTGLQVEPSQTTFDAAATKEYGFHVDDWFYQLTNADGQPVTGKDYQAKESVVPAGDGTVTSNGQWPWIGGTKIRDQVGGSVSSILFQTFDIKYNGQVYSLPQELVHEVTVDPNGVTSTRVFEIVPDPMP